MKPQLFSILCARSLGPRVMTQGKWGFLGRRFSLKCLYLKKIINQEDGENCTMKSITTCNFKNIIFVINLGR